MTKTPKFRAFKTLLSCMLLMISGLFCLLFIPVSTMAVAVPATIDTDLDITTNTLWDSGTAHATANITVKNGATLEMRNVFIYFGKEPGGSGCFTSEMRLDGFSPFDVSYYYGLRVESGGTLKVNTTTIRGENNTVRYHIVSEGTIRIENSIIENLGWNGIYVKDDDGTAAIIYNNKISNCSIGIELSGVDAFINSNTFNNIESTIINGYSGTVEINNNTFIGDDSAAIQLYQTDGTIADNLIQGGYSGIEISGGGGSNSTSNPLYLVWNDISQCRKGIQVYSFPNIVIENNTMSNIGSESSIGTAITINYQTSGTLKNNVITGIVGMGINLDTPNSFVYHGNSITGLDCPSGGTNNCGAVRVEDGTIDFSSEAFEFSDVEIVFTIYSHSTVSVRDLDLNATDIGTTYDFNIVCNYGNSYVSTYDVYFDSVYLQKSPYGDQSSIEMKVFWSIDYQAHWESNGNPVQDARLSVYDKDANEITWDNTDDIGKIAIFYIQEYSETKTSASNGTSTSQKTTYTPHTFQIEPKVGQKTFQNRTAIPVFEPLAIDMIVDDIPPPLLIKSPNNNCLVNTTNVTVSGVTEVLSAITMDGVIFPVNSNGNFTGKVELPLEGKNTITIISTDKGLNVVSSELNVFRDTIAPNLTVQRPLEGGIYNTRDMHVSGTTEPGANVSVQGQQVIVNANGTFSTNVTFSDEGLHSIIITSKDPAGNRVQEIRHFELDATSPYLIVNKPRDGFLTNSLSVEVQGLVEEGANLTVNGIPVKADTNTFKADVMLTEGMNQITIIAKDDAGNTNTSIRKVTLDTKAPNLNITFPTTNYKTNKGEVEVNGMAELNSSVYINGIEVENSDGSFLGTVILDAGTNKITVEAFDAVLNRAVRVVMVIKEASIPGSEEIVSVTSPANNTVTSSPVMQISGITGLRGNITVNGNATPIGKDGSFMSLLNLKEGLNIIKLNVTDEFGEDYSIQWYITLDTTPPDIQIDEPLGDVDQANILLKGRTEPGSIVTVNGLIVYVHKNGEFTAPVNLNPGDNVIIVTAVDDAGNIGTVDHPVKYVEPDENGTGDGVGELNSATTLGLMGLLLVLLVVVLVLIATLFSKFNKTESRGERPIKRQKRKKDIDEDDDEEGDGKEEEDEEDEDEDEDVEKDDD